MAETTNATAMATKPRCFVVMGFGIKTDFATGRKLDLDKSYRLLIKPSVCDAGLECIRADEIRHSGIIDVPMYRELLMSDFVVADLSTANPNALYELGIRHALRPRTTVVISESKLPYPFDLNHVAITSYTHLGDAIDYDEVIRFRRILSETLCAVKEKTDADSPVYTYLKSLSPPSQAPDRAVDWLEPAPQPVKAVAAVASKPATQDPTLAVLIQQGEQAIANDQFVQAKVLFTTALNVASTGAGRDGAVAHDPYLIQRLVLSTYKSKQPNHVEALREAKELLKVLGPEDSNDPETVGLAGAIEKRLFEEGQGLEHLKRAIWCYGRGYYMRNDWYNAINLAYLLNVRADSAMNGSDKECIADLVWANRIRRDVVELCDQELAAICAREARMKAGTGELQSELKARDRDQKFWCLATKAEANFGLGDFDAYASARSEAVAASHPKWMVQSLDGQIEKLRQLLTRRGHLLDPPWREPPSMAVAQAVNG